MAATPGGLTPLMRSNRYFQHIVFFFILLTIDDNGRSQNTVPLASTQAAIKGIVQYSTRDINFRSSLQFTLACGQDRHISRPVE